MSAVAGVDMAAVASAEGLKPSMGQSPFAIARGNTFERALLKEDAKALRAALSEAEVVPKRPKGFRDFRIRMNSGPLQSLDEAYEKTMELLSEVAAAGPDDYGKKAPAVVASATIAIPGQPVMLPDGMLAIDALAICPADDGGFQLIVGEVKSYPFRAGHTDAIELATSRAQAGLYQYALQLAIDEAGLSDDLSVSGNGFLVLSRHGRNDPQLLATEHLEHQAERARDGFVLLREAAKTVKEFDPTDAEEGIRQVEEAPIAYLPACVSFCDRAPGCRKRAEDIGDPNVLGEDVAAFLGSVDLNRALEILGGAEPKTDAEQDLAIRMQIATEAV